jgi:hypothetical protein
MRNPWRFDLFVGKWNDNDPRWLSGKGVDYRTQVPYKKEDDGLFFMDVDTFK